MYLQGGPNILFLLDMAADRYEPATTQLFKSLLREGMTVIDVGAHVGYFALLSARLVGPRGRVYAFEAEPSTYKVLVENVELNRYENVVPLDHAVSGRPGLADLFLGRATGEGISLLNRLYSGGAGEARVAVAATTLDDFLASQGEPHIDLLKMDIEGWEVRALEGMGRLLQRPSPPKLIIEFYPDGLQSSGAEPCDLLRKLTGLGFHGSIIGERGLEPAGTPERVLELTPPHDCLNLFWEKNRTTTPPGGSGRAVCPE